MEVTGYLARLGHNVTVARTMRRHAAEQRRLARRGLPTEETLQLPRFAATDEYLAYVQGLARRVLSEDMAVGDQNFTRGTKPRTVEATIIDKDATEGAGVFCRRMVLAAGLIAATTTVLYFMPDGNDQSMPRPEPAYVEYGVPPVAVPATAAQTPAASAAAFAPGPVRL